DVCEGRTHDDTGNQQIACFRAAAAHFHAGDPAASLEALRPIARDRSHIKHRESLFWLSRLGEDGALPKDFESFELADVEQFNNTDQRDVFAKLAFYVG